MTPGAGRLGGDEILVRPQVEKIQLVRAALVHDVGEVMPVVGERELLDIPRRRGRRYRFSRR